MGASPLHRVSSWWPALIRPQTAAVRPPSIAATRWALLAVLILALPLRIELSIYLEGLTPNIAEFFEEGFQQVLRHGHSRSRSVTGAGALEGRGVCVAGSCLHDAGAVGRAGHVARAVRGTGCRGMRKVWAVGRVRGWTGWWRRRGDASAMLGRRAERRSRRQMVGRARGGAACWHEAGHDDSAALGPSLT